MNDFVTLEQAKRLKAAGAPQGQFPQMMWWDVTPAAPPIYQWQPVMSWKEWLAPEQLEEDDLQAWYAAPTYLRALEWLEREKSIVWERWEGPSLGQAWWVIVHHDSRRFRTVSDILDAILDRIEAATPLEPQPS